MNENLILFIEKASKLEKSSFWKWAISKHGASDISAILDGNWLAHDGLNEEALDAFCLNLRLLIQPKDGFSINQIGDSSKQWPQKYGYITLEINKAIDELNHNLNQKSLVQIYHSKITTNNDIFKIIFYGGIAHCNLDKRQRFKELVTSGLFSYFVFQSFVSTLFHYRNCIKKIMRQIPDYLSMQSIKFALFVAASRLNSAEAETEANLLLQHTLKVDNSFLVANEDSELDAKDYQVFQSLLERRLQGESITSIIAK